MLFQWFKADRANSYTIPITFNSVFIVIAQLHSSSIDNGSSNSGHGYVCSAASVIYAYDNSSVILRKNMEKGQDHLFIIGT